MLFNSLEYFFFFVAVLIATRCVHGRVSARVLLLLAASYVFYVSNNGWLLLLILASTCIDYAAGLHIERAQTQHGRKLALLASVTANLSILGYYKYVDFFRDAIADAASAWGVQLGWVDLNVVLPVGISFYTFQSMSYTIDVYRGVLPAERSWSRFALYVAYFPQLIAGPIMRATYFLPQVQRVPKITGADVEWGVFLIVRGLFKKIVLADFLAIYADKAFALGPEVDSLDLIVGLYAFTLQIYFDFSGYTDIAIGCSRLLGYRIPDNFRRPYAALGFSDFWRRWHISLSTWLRDYLYISLGGNRGGRLLTYRNLMLTMLLGGLWHGAGWQFIVWGGLHGLYLCTERALGLANAKAETLVAQIGRRFVIFHCIVLTWLPFRSESLPDALEYLSRLLAFDGGLDLTRGMLAVLAIVIGAVLLQWWTDQRQNTRTPALGQSWQARQAQVALMRTMVPAKAALYAGCAVIVVIANAKGAQPFLYFQF